jgi:putative hydrolase of the HAD superfamily
MYLRRWGAKLQEVRAILLSKTWFGFDLDDTLHEFRQASNLALSSVLSKVNQDHGISIDDMQKEYRLILAEKTAMAFTDGRTSHEYRKERFQAVLEKFRISWNDDYLDALEHLYEAALGKSLCLKCGAFGLIDNLRKRDKKIVIITEGPQDAQEWTLEKLGISDKIDFLATTNLFRTSKVDGLLGKVLEHLQIAATDLVYIGDSWVRDMKPAMEERIYAVHYSEADSFSLDRYPIKVNTLKKLDLIIEDLPAQR